MKRDVFKPRKTYKPFEYPEVLQFTDAIHKSFWVHSEVDFTADIQDFHTSLEPFEKNAVKKALLAIAQIEVSVKTFWGNLYNMFPKPELNGLGSTFAGNEFIHSEAYSKLIEVLGFSEEFETVVEVPAIANRIEQLNLARFTEYDHLNERQISALRILMFSILVENVSLFSQFAVALYNARFSGIMKNIANVIAWTSVDEQIHANAGLFITNVIIEENPELLTEELKTEIYNIIYESIAVEGEIIDWIFEDGEFEKCKKADLLAYMMKRTNDSLTQIKMKPAFTPEQTELSKNLNWFEEEIYANTLDDFFAKRPVDYTKHDKSITENDLF